jgi:hypothetical protein
MPPEHFHPESVERGDGHAAGRLRAEAGFNAFVELLDRLVAEGEH